MKTAAYVIVFTITLLFSASGADVDARLLRFVGEIYPRANSFAWWSRIQLLLHERSQPGSTRTNAFVYRAITPTEYPTSFDANGKPASTDQRDTGIIFSGELAGDALDVSFTLDELATTALHRTETGAIIAQPLFRKRKVETKLTIVANEWQMIRIGDDDQPSSESWPSHIVLLVRVRK